MRFSKINNFTAGSILKKQAILSSKHKSSRSRKKWHKSELTQVELSAKAKKHSEIIEFK